jgi:hypothetical protein
MTLEPPPGLPRRRFSCLQPAVSRTRPVIKALSRLTINVWIAETPRASRSPFPARSGPSPFLSDWTPPIGWEGGPVHIRVRCAHSPGVGETTPGFIRTAIRISDDQINFNIHLTIHLNHVCGVAGLVPATLLF